MRMRLMKMHFCGKFSALWLVWPIGVCECLWYIKLWHFTKLFLYDANVTNHQQSELKMEFFIFYYFFFYIHISCFSFWCAVAVWNNYAPLNGNKVRWAQSLNSNAMTLSCHDDRYDQFIFSLHMLFCSLAVVMLSDIPWKFHHEFLFIFWLHLFSSSLVEHDPLQWKRPFLYDAICNRNPNESWSNFKI